VIAMGGDAEIDEHEVDDDVLMTIEEDIFEAAVFDVRIGFLR
jgi:hypothetical protein